MSDGTRNLPAGRDFEERDLGPRLPPVPKQAVKRDGTASWFGPGRVT
jgi:hypothetical protein